MLSTAGNLVTGGATALTVTDLPGSNTISGGSGGLTLAAGDTDVIATHADAADQLTLTRFDTLTGAGADHVTVLGYANTIGEAAAATVVLLGAGNLVRGGTGLLSLTDQVGGDTIAGGAGGLAAMLAGQYDSVSTAQGAADTVSLSGQSVLLSQGTDQITAAGLYDHVIATGAATIAGASFFSTYVLDGADSLAASGGGVVAVGAMGTASIASAGLQDLTVTKLAGGTASVSDSLAGGVASLTVSGGAATIAAVTGSYARLQAMIGAGVTVAAGTGNVTLVGGAGHDSFIGGTGQALISLGDADTVSLAAGTLTVQGGTADVFDVGSDAHGTLVITNWSGQDSLATPGQSAPAIVAQKVIGGSDWLTFASGAHVELVGVGHFG